VLVLVHVCIVSMASFQMRCRCRDSKSEQESVIPSMLVCWDHRGDGDGYVDGDGHGDVVSGWFFSVVRDYW
jgi:hypothetical protein